MARRALSATRAVELLEFFAAHPGEDLTYTQLAQRLGVNLSSMHSILMALTESAILRRDPVHNTYSLGPALVAIGGAALSRNPIIEEARTQLSQLSQRLGLEGLGIVRIGGEALCFARSGPPPVPGQTLQVGQRVPIVRPLYSIWMAWADEPDVARWLGLSENARPEPWLLNILEAVRKRGYSVVLEIAPRQRIGELLAELAETPHDTELRKELRNAIEELGPDGVQSSHWNASTKMVSTITAPVFDPSGETTLALSLQGFDSPLSDTEVDGYGRELCAVAQRITDTVCALDPTRARGKSAAPTEDR
jgi:DNA-binding IclR family transcriptional regulator